MKRRKIIAIISAIALLVCGITYTGKLDISAATTGTPDNKWHEMSAGGWQYLVNTSVSSITYTGGTSVSDGPTINLTKNNAWWAYDFQVRTPMYTIQETGLHTVTLTVNQVNTSSASYFTVFNGSGQELYTTYSNQTAVTSGENIYTCDLELTAGTDIYIVYVQHYSPDGARMFSFNVSEPSDETTTAGESNTPQTGIIDNKWHKIGPSNGNGWQYLLNTSASSLTYVGGTSIENNPTFTVAKAAWWDYDFQIKTPIYTIQRTGTHTITLNLQELNTTSASYFSVFNSDNQELYTTYNNQVPTVSGTTTYTCDLSLNAGTGIYIVYIQHYSPAGSKTFSFDVTEPGGAVDPEATAPTGVGAYNFYANGQGYQIVFKPKNPSTADSYNVYMDDGEAVFTTFDFSDCTDIGSGVFSTFLPTSTFSSLADNELHQLCLEEIDTSSNASEKSSNTPVRILQKTSSSGDPTDISRVYVVTNSDARITKEKKTNASLTVISGDSNVQDASYYGVVKLRGNSTKLADKPAYAITFNSKQKVLTNAVADKKWALLANAYEKTMMRNKLAMDFGKILGNVCTPEEQYTDLYIDGVYKGTFVLSETADNGRAGVSYDESGNDTAFEYEAERDETDIGVAYYRTSKYNMRFCNEEFEDEVVELYNGGEGEYTNQGAICNYLLSNNDKFALWANTLENFETALQRTNSTDYQAYIDEDSFVDMYIVNELFKTVDFQSSSVKFYVTFEGNTPTIHAGPLWDFDLSSGNSRWSQCRTYDTFWCQQNPWFGALMSNPNFASKVKQKYEDLQEQIQNIYKDNSLGKSKIKKNNDLMEASRIRNYSPVSEGGAGWSETTADGYENTCAYGYSTIAPYSSYTYAQHISFLETWLKNRNEWICDQWGISHDIGDQKEGNVATDVWQGFFGSWGTLSTDPTTYSMTEASIESDWYAIQTKMEHISMRKVTEYTCAFTLTSNIPKAFWLDTGSDSKVFFVEKEPGSWVNNGNGTYTYEFVGTFDNTVASEQTIRISYGYYGGQWGIPNDSVCYGKQEGVDPDWGNAQNTKLTLTLTDFIITPTGEYEQEPSPEDLVEYIAAEQTDLCIEGFQIRTNQQGASVAYRTVCKAPNIGATITAEGETYTVASIGTVYACDPMNLTGNHANNVLSHKYTILDSENTVTGEQYSYKGILKYDETNRTYGYVVSSDAILSSWNPEDTSHTYYAVTMQNMDDLMANTLYVRAYIVATDGTIIYSKKAAITSVAQIANYLYLNNYSVNLTAHRYLYSAILNNNILRDNDNIYYRTKEAEYGWDNNLYQK